MIQIVKRLELIKTGISLEDEEIIELQVRKIKSLDYDADVADILDKLEQDDFSRAVIGIEKYINSHTGMMPFVDVEIQGLKLELKALERHLQRLDEIRNDYITDIDDFNREYSLNLGEIIQKVLSLREERLYQQIFTLEKEFEARKEEYQKAKKEIDDIRQQVDELEDELEQLDVFSEEYDEKYEDYQNLKEKLEEKEKELNEKRKEAKQAKEEFDEGPANPEYQEAKEDAETFEKEYEQILSEDSYDLDSEQQKEFKAAFRRACRLCHPDIVTDELKEQAHKVMSELNAAKKKKDLDKVKEILLSLQTGEGFDVASDTINDRDLLEKRVANTKVKIDVLIIEITELENSVTFKTIQDIDDKGEYFENIKSQLEEELERLEKEVRQLKMADR